MFFGHISKVNKSQYPKAIRFALDYLQNCRQNRNQRT